MRKLEKFKFDYSLLFLLFLLGTISIITLIKAEKILETDNLVERQLMWYFIGSILIIFIIKIGNEKIYKYSFILYILGNISLISLLLFATPINNAKCWFNIPKIGTIQPSEFMKIILIIVIAITLTEKNKNEFKSLFKIGLIIFIPTILTFLEPDTGVVLIYLLITTIMLYIGEFKKRWFIIGISIIGITTILTIYIHNNNTNLFLKIFGNDFFLRVDRLLDWSNKNGYQLQNSLVSIGSGGLFGSKESLYIPESQTDFIFAIYANEFGFVGAIILLGIITLLDLRLIIIAKKAKNKRDKYVIAGILGMLLYQQIQNIGMNIGLMPITGITLPFISYGGSSLLSYMIMIGIVLNISDKVSKTSKIIS